MFLWLSGAALLCLAYGFLIEPSRLVVRHVQMSSPHWAGAPLRIAVMSDLHIGGRTVYAPRINKVASRLNAQSPDIIVLAGDYTSESTRRHLRSADQVAAIETGQAALGKLSAPLGVYAVLGNHDYLYGETFVQKTLEAGGITFVDNRAEIISGKLCLFGFGDDYYGHPNRNGRDACGGELPMIGLMHNPDSFELARGGEALLIAGHTHGGQINIPGIGRRATATRAGPKYAYGKLTINGSPAFVTAGIGMSKLSARFRAPPEIVVITLSRAET
ncbi:MAG: metallophosphoesterase [Alphaproteobacteria bacterium]